MRAMKIEELDDGECSRDEEEKCERQIVSVDAKRALVGAGARILFYPTLLYNVLRNKIEAEFRWWDQIDEVLLSLSLSILFIFVLDYRGFVVLNCCIIRSLEQGTFLGLFVFQGKGNPTQKEEGPKRKSEKKRRGMCK